jgi:hypothetical protein
VAPLTGRAALAAIAARRFDPDDHAGQLATARRQVYSPPERTLDCTEARQLLAERELPDLPDLAALGLRRAYRHGGRHAH